MNFHGVSQSVSRVKDVPEQVAMGLDAACIFGL